MRHLDMENLVTLKQRHQNATSGQLNAATTGSQAMTVAMTSLPRRSKRLAAKYAQHEELHKPVSCFLRLPTGTKQYSKIISVN